MGFDVHHTGPPLVWIIMSQQTVEILVEWLNPLKARMVSQMANWRSFVLLLTMPHKN
jgi:hypothetical protein